MKDMATKKFFDQYPSFIFSLMPWWKQLLALFLIALISKFIFFINHLSFSQDQVRDVLYIRDVLMSGKYFIPFGPSTSVGDFFLPPLYYYLQLLSHILFFDHFYSMDFLVIILESFTPLVIFFLAWKITSDKVVSFGAGLIYIFSVGVMTASSAWNPHLVPLFSTIFLFSFLCYFLEKQTIYLLGTLLSFMILINLHFQWFVLLPLILIITGHAIWKWRHTWKYLLITIIAGSLILSPYLWQEWNTNFENTNKAVNLLNSQEMVYERVRKPVYAVFFFPNYYQRVIFGDLFTQSWDDQYEIFQTTMIIGAAIFAVTLLICLRTAWYQYKQQNNKFLAAHLAIFLAMVVFLRIYKGDKPDYYLHVFLSFFPIYISVVFHFFTKNNNAIIRLTPFLIILLVELIALKNISPSNSYRSYKKLTSIIKEVSQNNAVLVAPTHQELEQPLTYFLSDNFFDATQIDTTDYYVLFCYAFQNCQLYLPNTTHNNNLFKYNHIDPKDFSYNWKNSSLEDSFAVHEGNYSAYFVRVNK